MFYFHTSVRFPAGHLKLDTPVELQGNKSICCHHDDPGDQEEQQQQGHIPARDTFGGVSGCKPAFIVSNINPKHQSQIALLILETPAFESGPRSS